jgi:glycosyltransferase involved in cell wall biosynthesis
VERYASRPRQGGPSTIWLLEAAMNILLLSHGVPYPPDNGPRAKTYQLLRHLAGRHRVTLVCLATDEAAHARAAALRPYCAELHMAWADGSVWRRLSAAAESLFGSRPALVARSASPDLHALLAHLCAEAAAAGQPYDLVHADQIQMAQFAEGLPLPRLLDAHNAVFQVQEHLAARGTALARWRARREAAQLRAYEGRICADFEAVTTVSEEDRDALLAAAGAARPVSVIPIGVDGRALRPAPRRPDARSVLSLSAPGWPPNAEGLAWFSREVYPIVRRAAPDSELTICGADPTPELRELAAHLPGLTVTGFVDPQPYIARASLAIAPLRSRGGMRVALLETLARGIPMVATSLACRGLDLRPGEHLLVADTPSAFADAVTSLLRDPALGDRIGAAGRRHALERYDWRALAPAVDRLYARMTAHTAAADEATGCSPVAIS